MDDQVYLTDLQCPRSFYDQMFSLPLRIVSDLAAAISRPPAKFIIIAEPDQADAIVPELRERFAGRLLVVRSHRNFVEGNPLDASKGQALARLAERLGIPQSQTAAIGDNDNDADMVAWAGLGLAMGNAHPDLKAIADVILPPVEQDGVAVAIEKYILASVEPNYKAMYGKLAGGPSLTEALLAERAADLEREEAKIRYWLERPDPDAQDDNELSNPTRD